MNWFRKLIVTVAPALCALLILAGCATTGQNTGPANVNITPNTIRPGEVLTIEFLDINQPQKIEQTVQQDGTINLILGLTVQAAGKEIGQLRQEIVKLYVPKYYLRMTVNIRQDNRFYFVGGEVKNPSQRPYTGEMTVVRAIQSAGDFTEFADKKNVEVTRSNGVKQKVNAIEAIKDPKKDLPVFPGDTVHVPQSLW